MRGIKTLGSTLAAIRRQKGMSLGAVAVAVEAERIKDERGEPISVGRPALSRIEAGEHLPQLRSMLALARIYDIEFVIDRGGVKVNRNKGGAK